MKKWALFAVFGFIAFIAFMVWSSQQGKNFRADVCVFYNGRKDCRTAIGATAEEATRKAQETACAILASGMTETMTCQRTPALSETVQPIK